MVTEPAGLTVKVETPSGAMAGAVDDAGPGRRRTARTGVGQPIDGRRDRRGTALVRRAFGGRAFAQLRVSMGRRRQEAA